MKDNLIKKIYEQGYPNAQTAPLVCLEEFFKGNEDEGSIGCNLMDHPGIDTFYFVLLEIKSKPSVQDVLVEIMEVEDEEYWPFSERIYILSSANPEEIEEWVKILEPDEIEEGYMFGPPPIAPELYPNHKVFGVWWD
ncbi:hypothetical protein P8831_12125 [Priestia megaterium]|uniref:hypothetical protein n=1 Tax=Priestia megaterium TaxID=1404 RepID=UPI002D7F632B|nr:hypothetical protein [Priestia megaterium]MEB4869464.1 hypothetical protein [Priestia megaterium]